MCRQWQLPWSRMERSSLPKATVSEHLAGTMPLTRIRFFRSPRSPSRSQRPRWRCSLTRAKWTWMDCVTKHLPEFQLKDPWLTREVRIADFLSHRTGLEDPDHSSGEFDRAEIIRRHSVSATDRPVSIRILLQQHRPDHRGRDHRASCRPIMVRGCQRTNPSTS